MKQIFLKILFSAAVMLSVVACSNQSDDNKEKKDEALLKNVEGEYQGVIKVPNQPLNILVSLSNEDRWGGTISIPVQGIQDYPLSNVTINETSVYFTMNIQGQAITFDGEREGESITGTFTQNGQSFPFELTRQQMVSSPGETAEEQDEFVSVETDFGTLYGELELPEGEGPYPVVLIIPGSGPTDRNGNSSVLPGKNDSLKLLAEELASHGIASVRYDKRGAGKNQEAAIPEADTRFDYFIDDAIAWIQLLKSDDRFGKVGVIGHSQGSLVGMSAAAQEGADVMISIAGAGQTIDKVLKDQLKEGLTETQLEEFETVFARLKQGETVEDVSQELYAVFRPSIQPFLSSWVQYDPTEEIQKLDMPVLLINGTSDIQVSEEEARILQEAKPDAELLIIDGMNHVLKEVPEGQEQNMESYYKPELPLADGLINGIMNFLQEAGFTEK